MTEKPTPTPARQDHPLANLMLNIIVPSLVLSYCSKESGPLALGPTWALVIGVAIPLAYGIYEFVVARKINAFSVLGMVSVVLTGGLGLMKTSAIWFACKEAAIPLILALAVLISHYYNKKPLARLFLLSPEMFDVPRIEARVAERGQQSAFAQAMTTSTWLLAGSFLVSTALNFGLWMYLLRGKAVGSPEYTAAIGRGTWLGFLVIGLPAMAILLYALLRLMKELERMTQLKKDDLLLPR